MVLLATAATIIASQAVITGAFSVASQAAKLGLLPRLRIVHTSASAYGQVYVPAINWMLMVSVLILVFAFESSAKLAYAYGMAVIGTITIVTLLFFYLARTRWGTPLWMVVIGGGALLLVDLLFLAANLTKLVHGAWLPLLIAVTAWTVMTTWERGRKHRHRGAGGGRGAAARVHRRALHVRSAAGARPRHRGVPQPRQGDGAAGDARERRTQPLRHEHVVIMSIETEPVPRVPDDERMEVDPLGYAQDGIIHVTAQVRLHGAVGRARARCACSTRRRPRGAIDVDEASYFLSKLELDAGPEPTMAPWRKRLFIATSYLTADAADFFHLPHDRTVIMGSRIEF